MLSLAACGNSDNSSNGSSGNKKVTITFQNIFPDPSTPSYKTLHDIAADYEKEHPNVKIEFDTLNTDQQKLKLRTQAAAKEISDITIVNPAAQMAPYVDAGLLAPLDDMVGQNGLKETYLPGLLDEYTFGDKLYAIPDGSNVELTFYNKELFAQAGISEVPTTFDALLDDVKKLKAAGITPIAIGEKDTWTGSFLFMNILLRTNNGPGFLKDVIAGTKTFEDPAFKEAVDRFQDLVQAGAFPDGAPSIDYNAGGNLFKSGKAAMYIMGTWETGAIDASTVAGKVGAFSFPTVGGKGSLDQFMLAPGSAFAIAANSKHLQETKDFLNYFGVNYPKKQFELKNAVGLGQTFDGDLKSAGYSDLAVDVGNLIKSSAGGDLSFDNTMNQAVAQAHLASIQNLFVQKVSADVVAKQHQDAFNSNK